MFRMRGVSAARARLVGVVSLLFAGASGCGGAPVDGPTGSTPTPTPSLSADVKLTIDSSLGRHAISPYIYGANQATWNGRQRYLRLGRVGGNRYTAYNWETNASNAGTDWYNQNDDYLGGGDTPGEVVRSAVASAHAAGAAMIVTVPMAGYVAADKGPGGDVNQTPNYLSTRFNFSQSRKDASFTDPPDTSDHVVYQDEFVWWLERKFPNARSDSRRTLFYCLDNEPDLWSATHVRIRPTGPVSYAELMARTISLAGAIKDVAPQALVFGPVSYGWNGFVSLQEAPDAAGRDFIDYYLDRLRAADSSRTSRLVDVLDLHWYPEAKGGGVRITESNTSAAVAAARMQAPRSLWDASYTEQSWISVDAGVGPIRLLPLMRDKIAAHYPGLRLAITEYDYGAGNHISGGIAQADVLGIFGREDVFAAARWGTPDGQDFVNAAFDAFTNYDGAGGAFGDTSISATTSDNENTSVYASLDGGNNDRLVVVAINKASKSLVAEIAISHGATLSRGKVYQMTAGARSLAAGPSYQPTSNNTFKIELPATSVTTLVLTK
jgi:hypothetical protein